jgi:hypothetical protein
MTTYEYKVVPAPTKGLKAKGVKTPEGRFANSVQSVLNTLGNEGWEYLRAELLPSEERSGLTGSTTNWRNVLVFRRATPGLQTVETPAVTNAIVETPAAPAPIPSDEGRSEPQLASGAERMLKDDGVEEISPVSGITEALKARAEQQAEGSGDKTDNKEPSRT